MEKENKMLLALFIIVALINLALAWILWWPCPTMVIIYKYVLGLEELSSKTVLKVQWWPLLLFVASSICAVSALRGKWQKLLVVATILLLVDFIALAFTLFHIAWILAVPMWELGP